MGYSAGRIDWNASFNKCARLSEKSMFRAMLFAEDDFSIFDFWDAKIHKERGIYAK